MPQNSLPASPVRLLDPDKSAEVDFCPTASDISPRSTAIQQNSQRVSSMNDASTHSGGCGMQPAMQGSVHDPPTSGNLRGRPPGCTRKASRTQQLMRNLRPRADRNASAATSGDLGEQEDMSTSEETCSKPGTEVPSLRRSERVKTMQTFYDASTGR